MKRKAKANKEQKDQLGDLPLGDRLNDLPPELRSKLEAIDQVHKQARLQYLEFEETVRHLDPVPRAEAWFKYVIPKRMDNDGDCEALVYLISRGFQCDDAIAQLNSEWKEREAAALSRSNEHYPDSPLRGSSITNTSTMVLPNFWYAHRSQADTIDATMLRTAEWCGIRGFEAWWRRVFNDATEMVLTGGLGTDELSAHFWLFGMCRSNYARSSMASTLMRCLEALEFTPVDRRTPWERYRERISGGKRTLRNVDAICAAASLSFARVMLGTPPETVGLLDEALAALQKAQHHDGYWPYWSDDQEGSEETTAMAVHALSLAQPTGWKRNVDLGAGWLLKQQHAGGYWQTSACPDPSFLSVLVLDALSLASDPADGHVTFSRPLPGQAQSVNPGSADVEGGRTDSDPYQFDVAFSFAGEVRGRAEGIATEVARVLDRDRVFYDNWFKALLARPNLDVYLQDIYLKKARLLVVFLSADYEKKEWCGFEFRALREIIKQKGGDRIMYLRTDEGAVTGVLSIDGYIDIRYESDAQVARDILRRLESVRQDEA